MKKLIPCLLVIIVTISSFNAIAQSGAEGIIRKLEQQEKDAVQKGDTVALLRTLWAPDFVVNNPANIVVTLPQIMELIRTGKISYESFDRIIEHISISGNIAIVMGREEVKPQGSTDNAGKAVVRRYTNIWIKRGSQWRLTARQATIVSVQ